MKSIRNDVTFSISHANTRIPAIYVKAQKGAVSSLAIETDSNEIQVVWERSKDW